MKGIIKRLEKALSSNLLQDKQVFQELLYCQTFSLVYIIVKSWFPSEVDDIISDIYTNKLLLIDLEKYESISDNLEGYIAITVKHYCQDLWKAKKREEALHNHLSLEQHTSYIQSNLDLDILSKHLSILQTKVIRLRFYENLTYFEIQQALQLPSESSARQHLSRGLKKLKKMLSP